MTLNLNFFAKSDRGLIRGNNEDSGYAGSHLLILADGMGGHAAGEVASQLMVNHLEILDQDPGKEDMEALLAAAADDANDAISAHVTAHPETKGMGTTLTTMLFNGTTFGVCHVGDSRGYVLRDGKLEQITKDDTYVQSLVDTGELAAEDVSSHPQKSLILKAYTGRAVEPTLFTFEAKVGDRILLCSDGLSDPVTASTIETALSQGSIEQAGSTLVDLAIRSGGPDNVTVVIGEVTEEKPAAHEPFQVGALASSAEEPTHPDSSASRAAKLTRKPQVIPPAVMAQEDNAGKDPDEEEAEDEPSRRKVGWKVLIALISVLVLVIGAGLWAKNFLFNNYYAETNNAQEITIRKGADYSLFGSDLNSMHQYVCINDKKSLLFSARKCEGDFTPLKVSDLPESERGAVNHISPGALSKVQDQINNLGEKALKPCITTPTQKENKDTKEYKPGVTCREV
ncbi:protein phosphatase 2C domain-containing protein [Corynebacterium macginleyi]|uniref:protein phosphatase 2C domain-containing protein n=1 Tax=Corynebacterium macginleyi TaxID=38290 RepID=UPI00190BC2B8|nr:serine/threonine-protein phosphatase [Corynebacterium macginleyi]